MHMLACMHMHAMQLELLTQEKQRLYGELRDRGLTEEASLPLDVALDNLDRTAAPSPGLLLDTLSALNRLYTQDPSLATVAGARESLERELSVAAERFAPDSNEYVETLARCAAAHAAPHPRTPCPPPTSRRSTSRG